MYVKDEKDRLRREYKKRRLDIPENEKRLFDERICNRFLSLVSYRFADTLLAYAPLDGEVDISQIVKTALKNGKKVAFPRCIPESFEMTFHYVKSEDELERASYGIREPSASAPLFDKKSVIRRTDCVCLIPAVLYDRKGYRIGYGKGYYDRFFSDFDAVKVGVVYNDFIKDTIPHGRYDLSVDMTVSERGAIVINEN